MTPRSRSCSGAALALCLVAALLVTSRARATSPLAETLFQEGRRLMEEGKIDEACVKLGESFAQEASSGILINLALCHETQGKLATAWAEYLATVRLARAQGREDRAEAAEERARKLEQRLPRLTVVLKEPNQPVRVSVDGVVVGVGALGVPLPVDPGVRTVVASGTSLKPWTSSVELKEGQTLSVEVPKLEAEPPPRSSFAALPATAPPPSGPAPASPGKRPKERGGSSVKPGWFVVGGGVASLGVGAVFGLVSLSEYKSADRACPTHVDCSPDALADRKGAETTAWISNVAFGVGALATAVGVVLVVSSKDAHEARALRAGPLAGGAWVGVDERF